MKTLQIQLSKAQYARLTGIAKMAAASPVEILVTEAFSGFDGWSSWAEFSEGRDSLIEEYHDVGFATTHTSLPLFETTAPRRVQRRAGPRPGGKGAKK